MYCSIKRWVYFRERENHPLQQLRSKKEWAYWAYFLEVRVLFKWWMTTLAPVSLRSHWGLMHHTAKLQGGRSLYVYSYHISSTRCCSQKVVMASIHDAETRVPSDAHWAISRVACVLRLASMADSRTERLCVLLPASIRPSCIACMYLIQLSLLSFSFPTN